MAIILDSLAAHIVVGGLLQTVFQLLCFVLPFAALALVLHALERVVQSALSRRFGWRSVFCTAWLGVPVHELSHAALCLIFFHRIDELALFKPDPGSGRLGYVKHSYDPRNPYQVIGNFFIGMAPLAGGTCVLYALLWLLFPDAARAAFADTRMGAALAEQDFLLACVAFLDLTRDVLVRIVAVQHLLSWRFWLFVYLTLCIGIHAAPSLTDYRGAVWGGLLLLVVLVLLNLLNLALAGDPSWLVQATAAVFGTALALFALCVILSGLAALIVVGLTKLIDLIVGRRMPKH